MPKCPACKDPEHAKEWGCFEPTEEPTWWIECVWCSGLDDDCPRCGGECGIPQLRCPNSLELRNELDIVSSVALVEQGVLPSPGGWDDQSAQFVAAHPIVASEIGKQRQAAMERAQKKPGKTR